jgi:hypothetical protein
MYTTRASSAGDLNRNTRSGVFRTERRVNSFERLAARRALYRLAAVIALSACVAAAVSHVLGRLLVGLPPLDLAPRKETRP